MDDLVLSRLIERLADADYGTRKHAVRLLVEKGDAAVPALIAALGDPRLTVQVRAVEALGRIGSAAAAAPVARLLQMGDHALLTEVALALTRLAERGIDVREALARYDGYAAQDGGPPQRQAVVREREAADRLPLPPLAGHRGVPAFTGGDPEALIVHLRSANLEVRKAAGERLAELGAASVPALAAEMARRHPLSGPRAVQTLAETGHPSAVEPLVALRVGNDYDLVFARHEALESLALRLARRPYAEDDLPAIARLLAALPVGSAALGALAEHLAAWAQASPCPGLRRVLKPLKAGLLRPLPPHITALRRAIDAATSAWKDLPLPASAPLSAATDLPRPSEEQDA